jgi:hypothetical protein
MAHDIALNKRTNKTQEQIAYRNVVLNLKFFCWFNFCDFIFYGNQSNYNKHFDLKNI